MSTVRLGAFEMIDQRLADSDLGGELVEESVEPTGLDSLLGGERARTVLGHFVSPAAKSRLLSFAMRPSG